MVSHGPPRGPSLSSVPCLVLVTTFLLHLGSWFLTLGAPLGTLLDTSLGPLLGSPPDVYVSWLLGLPLDTLVC